MGCVAMTTGRVMVKTVPFLKNFWAWGGAAKRLWGVWWKGTGKQPLPWAMFQSSPALTCSGAGQGQQEREMCV